MQVTVRFPPNLFGLFSGYMDPKANPAPYINDALFGKCDGESDEYEAQDEALNALLMSPCLRRRSRLMLTYADVC